MKTLFAVLAIFICPTFAFGDTIGPSTGCANSASIGDTYSLNLTYPGNQIVVDCILGVADFSERTANLINEQGDDLNPFALNSKIPITRMRLRHADGGLHEWSASTDNERSFGYASRRESFRSAAHVWEPLLTTHESSLSRDEKQSDLAASDTTGDFYGYAGSFAKLASLDSRRRESSGSAAHLWEPLLASHRSSLWGDQEQSDLVARNTTGEFYPYPGSFARPALLDSRKDSRDNQDSNKKDDDGKSGSGKDGKKGDSGDRAKNGGDDGYKGGGDDGGKGGGDDGGKGGSDDVHTRKVPEPGSLILLGTGLLIGGALLRKFAA